MALGLCINAANSVPDAAECALLGMGRGDWARTHVAGSLSLLDGMLATIPADVAVMVSLNNECHEVGWDWAGWENTCRIIAAKYAGRVKIVGAGNELDLWHLQPPVGEPDPRLTPGFAAELVRAAAAILHPAGIKVAMSSVASGVWPDYLDEMASYCRDVADYADLHLYVKRVSGIPEDPNWQTAAAALLQAEHIAGLPVIASEAGIKVDDAGGLERQAQWASGLRDLRSPLVCYFAWADSVGTPSEQGGQAFGARGPDGRAKPVWYALQKQFGGHNSQPPTEHHAEFVLGFAKWAAIERSLLGDPVRNERNVAPQWQTQRTTNGTLAWVGGKGHSFVRDDGRVWHWEESWPASREVPG